MFLNEFSGYLEEIITSPGKPLIVGEFNFHVDDLEKESAASFIDILNTFKLKQHVTFPVHVKGHTLDLVITLGATVATLSPPTSEAGVRSL